MLDKPTCEAYYFGNSFPSEAAKADMPDSSQSVEPQRNDQDSEILYRIFEFAPDAILVVDARGRITKANEQAHTMFGYGRNELLGQPVEILIPARLSDRHVGHRTGYIGAPRTRTMGAGLDLFGRRKDGTEFPVDIMLSPLNIESKLVLGIVRDVTERKKIEAQAIAAREMYLKEIHHRVKNNLQVISSLLFLQSQYLTDPAVHEILKESQTRVKSIALIHEKLYRSAEQGRVNFGEYIRDLVSDLFNTYRVNQEIKIAVAVENISLEIDTAIPCGLIINELVSNVLKHAFTGTIPGEVQITLNRIGDKKYELFVRDNGNGLPENFNWRTAKSLGLKLVQDLTRQLEGHAEVRSEKGTEFRIEFSEVHYKERS